MHEEFIDQCLRYHNEKRRLHGVAPLRHNRFLDESAQEWANQLIHSKDGELYNSPASNRGEIGESISMRSSSGSQVQILGSEVVEQWYNDIKNYDFVNCKGPAGSFTQLVWSGTKEVGFGKATIGGKCIVVAHYRPPGNIRGKYQENVFSIKKEFREMLPQEVDEFDQPGARKSVNIEYVVRDGREMRVKKETSETVDEHGNIRRKVREIYLDDENYPKNQNFKNDEDCLNGHSSVSEDDFTDSRNFDEQSIAMIKANRKYTRQIVHLHNQHRIKHGVSKLRHNKRLSTLAQEFAEKLINETFLSNSGYIYNGERLGENVASRWSNNVSELSANDVIDGWYSESQKFKYGTEPSSIQGIGNFSQMVWKSSQIIGVGRACRVTGQGDDIRLGDSASSLPGLISSRCVVVCFYYPPGNVATIFSDNVTSPVDNLLQNTA